MDIGSAMILCGPLGAWPRSRQAGAFFYSALVVGAGVERNTRYPSGGSKEKVMTAAAEPARGVETGGGWAHRPRSGLPRGRRL